jgi:ribosome recycling factor
MQEIEERMKKTIESTRSHLGTIRTGRANPNLLSRIQVDYYGTMVPLQQVANISVPENMILMLNIFDKGAVQNVERAIQMSDLGINPMTEGSTIRLRLPDLTEERRTELVKIVKKQTEDGKIAIRNIRRDDLDNWKAKEKNKEISEDDYKKRQHDVQNITDKYISVLDTMAKEKDTEIMTV